MLLDVLSELLLYVHGLKFEEEPDYKLCISRLEQAINKLGLEND